MQNYTTYPAFMDLLSKRYSCRRYNPALPIDPDLVGAVVEAARLAPSACNRQPWTFVAVTDADTRHAMLAKSRPSFVDAPVVLVALGHHDRAWHRPTDDKDHTDIDLAIACEHICLAATALGLGTCWVCSFDTDAVRRLLDLPTNVEPVALIPLGYPMDDEIPAKNRMTTDDILRWEKF